MLRFKGVLTLGVLVLLEGCATGPPHGHLLSGYSQRSLAPSLLARPAGPTSPPEWEEAEGSAGGFPSSSAEVLAPFLACASPGEFVARQHGVDMPPWHHHQDGTTMQLVPTDKHARTGHTGGFSGGQE